VAFNKGSYGCAIIPKVTKAGIGATVETGLVYENGTNAALSRLKQASIGFQLGGHQCGKLIFVQHKAAYENFINRKMKFDAQESAVAIKS
jgi:hypothetical protein